MQIERTEHFTRIFLAPIPCAIFALFAGVALGLVFSLIIAAFLKRAAPPPNADAVPPPL